MDKELFPHRINTLFNKILHIKIRKFEKTLIRKYSLEESYKLKSPILLKHFMFKAYEELSNKLEKNKNILKTHYDGFECNEEIIHDYFKDQGCISDSGEINYSNFIKEISSLNRIIRENYNDKEIMFPPSSMKPFDPKNKIILDRIFIEY